MEDKLPELDRGSEVRAAAKALMKVETTISERASTIRNGWVALGRV
ncbi:MAG: hypothetical protein IPK37_11965 [Austwickia sp.]|jgi:hypothetical protein|nr:MAG: hypothetical protein IPK37_11965 [Austwickia sp.]